MASSPLLDHSSRSLLHQSHVDKRRPQGDGWGFGWFEGGKPRIFKSSKAMYRDQSAVRRAAGRVRGNALIGHVRWASNPLKLKRHELIGLAHTQPFTHQKWIFAHNGTLLIPKEVAGHLGLWKKYLKGKNDSEVLFYWLLKHLNGRKNIKTAVRQSIQGLHKIWKSCKKSYPIYAYPYHGLNWVLSDGKTLFAFCYADPRGWGKAKALGAREQPYYQLQRQITENRVIVASEPMDDLAPWKGFRQGELFVAQRRGHQLLSRTVRVQ